VREKQFSAVRYEDLPLGVPVRESSLGSRDLRLSKAG